MKRTLATLAAAALVGGILLLTARGQEPRERGWKVIHGNHVRFFPEENGWEASPNPGGFTLTNSKEASEIYYYGTFYVERTTRGQ